MQQLIGYEESLTLIARGAGDQKRFHLPRILRGEPRTGPDSQRHHRPIWVICDMRIRAWT